MAKEKIPYHSTTVYLPDGTMMETAKIYPIGRAKARYYCKYCYQKHEDWWQMQAENYGGEDVILCGLCRHTSKKEFAEL